MTTLNNADPWAALMRVVEQSAPADYPGLLGELERLKAILWVRMALPSVKQAPSQPDCLLTAKEVAQRLGMTREYIYRNATKYPFTVREGRYVRFSQAGLTRYLERRQGK